MVVNATHALCSSICMDGEQVVVAIALAYCTYLMFYETYYGGDDDGSIVDDLTDEEHLT